MQSHHGRAEGHLGGSFARIPEHVVYAKVARGARPVLEAVAHRSDYLTGLTNGDCSVRQLGAALNLAPRTVRYHLAHLLAAGLIVLVLPRRGIRPPVYRLAWLGGDIHSARPDRALAPVSVDLVRGDTAQGARPHRALVRGHTAHNSETELSQSAGAGSSDDDAVPSGGRIVPRELIDAAIREGRASVR